MDLNPRQWERQVAAARAYTKLTDEEKATLEGLPKADRNALHYEGWEITPAERRALRAVPLIALKEAIHDARPDVTIGLRFRQDGSGELQVFRQQGEEIRFYGFDRCGDIGPDGLNFTRVNGAELTSAHVEDFDPVALAATVAEALTPAPTYRKYGPPAAVPSGEVPPSVP